MEHFCFWLGQTPSRGQTALVFEGKHRRRAMRVPHYWLAIELDGATTTRKPMLFKSFPIRE